MPFNTNSFALVVGVGKRDEDFAAMTISATDSFYISKALSSFDILPEANVTLLCNEAATTDNVLNNLKLLVTKTQENPADFVLIYFSGHGIKKNNEYQLICRSTTSNSASAINGEHFVTQLKSIRCVKMLVLLDCCRSEGIATSEIAQIPFNENVLLDTQNRVIITACAKNQYSYLSKPVSLFTYAVIEALGGKFLKDADDKCITLFGLAMDVRERVAALSKQVLTSGSIQQPQLNVLRNSRTINFEIVRYPTGGPQKVKLLGESPLQAYDGSAIDCDVPSERDDVERAKFNWIVFNIDNKFIGNSVVNQTIIVQVADKNSIVVINNGHESRFENRYSELHQFLQSFPGADILFREKSNSETFDINGVSADRYDYFIGNRKFNEFLTKHTIASIKSKVSSNQQIYLNCLPDDWEKDSYNSDIVKNMILQKYGILGFLLQRLFSIGKDPLTQYKLRSYCLNCTLLSMRILQLMTYSLLSHLWTEKCKEKFSLTSEQKQVLSRFFIPIIAKSISSEFEILVNLYAIFLDRKIELPIPEIRFLGLEKNSNEGIRKVCGELDLVQREVDADKCTLDTCFRSECFLTELLKSVAFLCDYKMVSMKEISYEKLPHDSPKYFHSFSEITFNEATVNSKDRVKYSNADAWTDAILLFKEEYQVSTNLFPFIFDLNALNFETGNQLFFFSYQHPANEILTYQLIDSYEKKEHITYDAARNTESIDTLRSEVVKKLKLNKVYQKLHEAKSAVLE